MTEPQGGADPGDVFTCKPRPWKATHWVIEGEKWFSSNAKLASFLLVIAITDPDKPLTERMSMFIVPTETPGIRHPAQCSHSPAIPDPADGHHAHIRYEQGAGAARSHARATRGGGFKVAQARLGGGRIHHAMRTVGKCHRAIST